MMNEHQIYQIDCMNIMLKMELADSQFVGVAQNAPHLALVPAELPPAGFSLQKQFTLFSNTFKAIA